MQRAKPKKKSEHLRPAKNPMELVTDTNYLNLAVFIRILYTCYGWRKKRLSDALEAYAALMQELADKRSTVKSLVDDTKKLTGFDVKELLDEVFRND